MSQSVRLRLIDWLQRVRDYVAKQHVDGLRSREVHPDAVGDDYLTAVSFSINDARAKGQIYDAVNATRLRDPIDVLNARGGVHNVPGLGACLQDFAGFQNNLVVSQSFDPSCFNNQQAVGPVLFDSGKMFPTPATGLASLSTDDIRATVADLLNEVSRLPGCRLNDHAWGHLYNRIVSALRAERRAPASQPDRIAS